MVLCSCQDSTFPFSHLNFRSRSKGCPRKNIDDSAKFTWKNEKKSLGFYREKWWYPLGWLIIKGNHPKGNPPFSQWGLRHNLWGRIPSKLSWNVTSSPRVLLVFLAYRFRKNSVNSPTLRTAKHQFFRGGGSILIIRNLWWQMKAVGGVYDKPIILI